MYREEYYSMKEQWKPFSEVQLQRFQFFGEHREFISEQLIVIIEYIAINEYFNATLSNNSLHSKY